MAAKGETQKGREGKRRGKATLKRGAQAKRPTKAARSKSAPSARARRPNRAAGKRGAPPAASTEVELEAAVLRRLLQHFDERKDVQNIELMILAGFCRNCLSRWMVEAAQERGVALEMERAREKVYGMPYSEWKERHQPPATEEQLARFAAAERRASETRNGTTPATGAAKAPAKNQ